MENYYPVFLDLKGKRVLVVGGGQVALRKVKSLLECGADVFVVAPEAVPELRQMALEGCIRWINREYAEEDLEGASLVIRRRPGGSISGYQRHRFAGCQPARFGRCACSWRFCECGG